MKSLLLFIFLLISALGLQAEAFKFRNVDLPDLAAALAALDGAEKAVDQGPGNPARLIREPYSFTGDVRTRLAADLAVINEAVKRVQLQRDALIKQISGGGDRIDPKQTGQMADFAVAASTLLEAEIILELSPITAADLQLDKNAIPVSVLAILGRLRPKT